MYFCVFQIFFFSFYYFYEYKLKWFFLKLIWRWAFWNGIVVPVTLWYSHVENASCVLDMDITEIDKNFATFLICGSLMSSGHLTACKIAQHVRGIECKLRHGFIEINCHQSFVRFLIQILQTVINSLLINSHIFKLRCCHFWSTYKFSRWMQTLHVAICQSYCNVFKENKGRLIFTTCFVKALWHFRNTPLQHVCLFT